MKRFRPDPRFPSGIAVKYEGVGYHLSMGTVGYQGKRYTRIFNDQLKRHEWWECKKTGRHEDGSIVVELIKRVSTHMVSALWDTFLAKLVAKHQ